MTNVNILNVSIERVKENELDSVYYIEKLSFRYPYPEPLLLFYYRIFPEGFLVAKLGDKIVGYIIFLIERNSIGHIISLAVHPDYRRRGIGYMLISSAISFLSSLNIKSVKLEVRVSNTAAIKLYEKVGFRKNKLLRRYYMDGEDGYLMIYSNLERPSSEVKRIPVNNRFGSDDYYQTSNR